MQVTLEDLYGPGLEIVTTRFFYSTFFWAARIMARQSSGSGPASGWEQLHMEMWRSRAAAAIGCRRPMLGLRSGQTGADDAKPKGEDYKHGNGDVPWPHFTSKHHTLTGEPRPSPRPTDNIVTILTPAATLSREIIA